MSYWSSLKLNAGSPNWDYVNNITTRFRRRNDGKLVYKSKRAYDNIFIFSAKRFAFQQAEAVANSLFPKYRKYLEKKNLNYVREQQIENHKQLIANGEIVDNGFGVIEASGNQIIAQNKYGDKFPEALMIYYKSDKEITINTEKEVRDENGNKTGVEKYSYKTDVICFIDVIASVSIQSSKNLVLTQVQGRDFTRKELVSGGDLDFSVSGKIVEDQPNVYPSNQVKKFIQIAQYGGVISVNHYLFNQFNVKQILIKDFSLGTSTQKNVQPYSFTCVAVEPDEDVIIATDTIGILNKEVQANSGDAWYKFILSNKALAIGTKITNDTSLASATVLDKLIPNI